MSKEIIRKKHLKKRAALLNRASLDDKIHTRLLAEQFYREARVIMLYLSYKSEVDTHGLLSRMFSDGKTLCAPVCKPNGKMDAFAFSDIKTLVTNKMGIEEPSNETRILPEDIDLILVPGCAFQKNGYRIGYGGGYYDRYLPKTRAVTCGLFYEALKADFTPDETDIPLDYIITEERLYHFK